MHRSEIDKEQRKLLKAVGGGWEYDAFKGLTIRLTGDFSTKVKEFIRQWNNIPKVLKKNKFCTQ